MRAPLLLALLLAGGCTGFATARSARVEPGVDVAVQVSASTPPGDEAGWFWSMDCGARCEHGVGSLEVSVTRGIVEEGRRSASVSGGFNGTQLFAEGYLQLRGGDDAPLGVGGRLGFPMTGWWEHRVFARYDLELADGATLWLNPALFYHGGASPNGQVTGSFVAFTQAVGLALGDGGFAVVPTVAWVAGRGRRDSWGEILGPFRASFWVASAAVVF